MPRKKDNDDEIERLCKLHPELAETRRLFSNLLDYKSHLLVAGFAEGTIKIIHLEREINGITDICIKRGHQYMVEPHLIHDWIKAYSGQSEDDPDQD